MAQIIRITTVDGSVKDFPIRDSNLAYSYYNSRQSRPGPDGEHAITEWKVLDIKYSVNGESYDSLDVAMQALAKAKEEAIAAIEAEEIKTSEAIADPQPLEFPTLDWLANPAKNTVVKSEAEIRQIKLEENKTLDGDAKARSFSSHS